MRYLTVLLLTVLLSLGWGCGNQQAPKSDPTPVSTEAAPVVASPSPATTIQPEPLATSPTPKETPTSGALQDADSVFPHEKNTDEGAIEPLDGAMIKHGGSQGIKVKNANFEEATSDMDSDFTDMVKKNR